MPYKTNLKFKGSDQRLKPVPHAIYPAHHRSVGVQAADGGEYLLFVFFLFVGTDGSEGDSEANESLVSQLKIEIKKLEQNVNHYAKEMLKYRTYWKNECRSTEADRYDLGGVLQTSWSSPSPYRVYGELFNTNTSLTCIEI